MREKDFVTTDNSCEQVRFIDYQGVKVLDVALELFEILLSKGLKVAFAESLTGGMISSYLVDIPGSSCVFDGAVVSYSNEIKNTVLNVSNEILDTKGAVSPECAITMAEGVYNLIDCDIALSVTGIAGPGGATHDKDVGLVYIGVTDGTNSNATMFKFSGNRFDVRQNTAIEAFRILVGVLDGKDKTK